VPKTHRRLRTVPCEPSSDLLDEKFFPLVEGPKKVELCAARLRELIRSGQSINGRTIYLEWCRLGGGRWGTSEEAYRRFLKSLNDV